MITVTTPGGTPSVAYNRDGQTIDSIVATGTNQATAAAIVRFSWWTIVSASGTGSPQPGIKMPANAEVGDLVEIHNSGSILLWPESGGQIDSGGTNNAAGVSTSALFRRLSANNWVTVSSS